MRRAGQGTAARPDAADGPRAPCPVDAHPAARAVSLRPPTAHDARAGTRVEPSPRGPSGRHARSNLIDACATHAPTRNPRETRRRSPAPAAHGFCRHRADRPVDTHAAT
ncbi:hypothetical protein ACFPM0_26115 [Pseudonocardia sulfidoxydans]|uniref:hypothetical protein n=1 Tax=Pseudonocardia sulfidoxydans TaxID=54011 RepID=UPI00361C4F45